MTVPEFQNFLYPTLEILSSGEIYTKKKLYDEIIIKMGFNDDDLNEMTRQGSKTKIKDRLSWSITYLNNTPLIERVQRGKYKITKEGQTIVDNPSIDYIDSDFLLQYEEFRKFKGLEINYWVYAPGEQAYKWDSFYEKGLMGIGWAEGGDLTQYKSRNEIVQKLQRVYHSDSKFTNDSLALWQFACEIKKGDIIYVKKGIHEIIGYGIVTSDYFYDETIDTQSTNDEYYHWIKVDWKEKGNWTYKDNLPLKTLTKITDNTDLREKIDSNFNSVPIINYSSYDEYDFLNEAYLDKKRYDELSDLIYYKKNVILYGAPGVGKTFISKRLAYSIIGYKDEDKIGFVQFHQSYSYEDFIMGYRPSDDGFKLKTGVFYDFCKKASNDDDNDYFFIIDEINRGNLNKIFGELFMLIENDKRGEKYKIKLLYDDEEFYIPENVHIIGMMNTADRSLAMIDYALRRRFSFFKLEPAYESENFQKYIKELDNHKLNQLIETVKQLNDTIKNDESLGEGFQIGHSYFSNINKDKVDDKLKYIVNYELIPLLEEYWFDEEGNVEEWSEKLRSVIM